jgi:hypothetical protein
MKNIGDRRCIKAREGKKLECIKQKRAEGPENRTKDATYNDTGRQRRVMCRTKERREGKHEANLVLTLVRKTRMGGALHASRRWRTGRGRDKTELEP